MTPRPTILIPILALAGLLGCVKPLPTPDIAALSEPGVVRATTTSGPPGAEPGTCWGRDVSPAIVETVTEQIMLQPAEVLGDGTVINPAAYKTETRQMIVRERRETWFRTPCDEDLPIDFTATLQRALQARGHYRGPITGEMDARTRAAIRRYQAPQGLDSAILSLQAAQTLGLVAVLRQDG